MLHIEITGTYPQLKINCCGQNADDLPCNSPFFTEAITKMASFTKYAKGYRVQIAIKGVRESASFRTKREAEAWAGARETEIREQAKLKPKDRHTLLDAMRKYGEEVSNKNRGHRWELVRLKAFEKQLPVAMRIGDVSSDVLSVWRDKRLAEVSRGSVLRDISLLSAVFESARLEWRWIDVNPLRDMRKPKSPDHRYILITRPQIKGMCRIMGYRNGACKSASHAAAVAFLVALRTGMRAGELCGLTWNRVHAGYCALPITKTVPRDVPLSPKAQRLIESMRGWDSELVFGLKAQTLDALFRRYRARANLEGFTFHDSRHTAATWISQKLAVLDLCKMFGWSDPKQALVYYNPHAKDIAKRL